MGQGENCLGELGRVRARFQLVMGEGIEGIGYRYDAACRMRFTSSG